MSETDMPGYREPELTLYGKPLSYWRNLEAWSIDLQWSLDEQKKLYNALTNTARELQNENVALKGEVESERIERRAAIEGREQAMKEMYRQVEKCGLLDLEIERLKSERDILSAGLTKETEEIERLNEHNAKLVEACNHAIERFKNMANTTTYSNDGCTVTYHHQDMIDILESALASPAEKAQ